MSISGSRGTRLTRRALAPIIISVAFAAMWSPVSHSMPKSIPLHGFMHDIANFPCNSPTGVCSSFTVAGSINGEGTVFVETFPFPFPKATTDAHTVIQTNKGELRCEETAVFDLAGDDHAFVDLCLIRGGTGVYEGASGYIQEAGTFDFATNHGELEYDGKLIFAR